MKIDFYSYSGLGGRPVNEDSYITGNGCYIVSDGLGGHDNGEVASGAAIRYIAENFASSDLSDERIGKLILGADEAVKRSGEGGKATLAAVFTDGDIIRVDNIGDSRVYYFRHGSISFRTKDHSVCQASVDMGEMTDMDVRSSADRSGLFKVLGDDTALKLPKPYDTIEPIDGDAFLICSDGFWENVYEAEMEADLLKAENARDWLTHMLKRHFLRARNEGDNFTAICGIIHSPNTFPRTMSVPGTSSVKAIPRTADLADLADLAESTGIPRNKQSPPMPLKYKIFVAACAVVAVAAIGTALMLIANKDGGETSDNSSSVTSNDISETSGISEPAESSGASEPAESSGASELAESSGSSEPAESSGSSEPAESSGSSEPAESSGSSEPAESSGASEPAEPSTPPDTSDTPGTPENSRPPLFPHFPNFPMLPRITAFAGKIS